MHGRLNVAFDLDECLLSAGESGARARPYSAALLDECAACCKNIALWTNASGKRRWRWLQLVLVLVLVLVLTTSLRSAPPRRDPRAVARARCALGLRHVRLP